MNIKNNLYIDDLRYTASYLPENDFSILVTGATGLIGSFIIDTLRYANHYMKHKHTIFALGKSEKKLRERFPETSDDLRFIIQNAQQPIDDNIKVDYIINAASNADPKRYALFPSDTIMTNILGTYHALEYAKKHKAKVLMMSTMEVYGETQNESKSETDFGLIDFNQIRSCYPESKRLAELLCKCYLDEYGVNSIIARLGYVYGPTMSKTDSKVVAQFIRNIINKENIVLKSNGTQRRSYCYVADAVSGIFVALFKGTSGESYNIASKKSEITIKDLAVLASEIAGTKVVYDIPTEIEKKGSSVIKNNVLNVEKIEKLGWSDKYNVEEGLKRTVDILSEKLR